MIEILEGVFYDPAKEWYEQPQELIELALQIEQTQPIDYEFESLEVNGLMHNRLKYGMWEHTTEIGTFRMRVDIVYLYPIEHRAFLTKAAHNRVTLTKVNNE